MLRKTQFIDGRRRQSKTFQLSKRCSTFVHVCAVRFLLMASIWDFIILLAFSIDHFIANLVRLLPVYHRDLFLHDLHSAIVGKSHQVNQRPSTLIPAALTLLHKSITATFIDRSRSSPTICGAIQHTDRKHVCTVRRRRANAVVRRLNCTDRIYKSYMGIISQYNIPSYGGDYRLLCIESRTANEHIK